MWLVTSLPYQLTCGLLLPPAHSFIKFGPFWCTLSITWSCNAEILSRQGCKLYCLSWSVLPQLGILTREWKRVLEEVTYQFLAWTLFFWAQDAQIVLQFTSSLLLLLLSFICCTIYLQCSLNNIVLDYLLLFADPMLVCGAPVSEILNAAPVLCFVQNPATRLLLLSTSPNMIPCRTAVLTNHF